MKRKICTLAAILILTLSQSTSAFALTLNDHVDHYGEDVQGYIGLGIEDYDNVIVDEQDWYYCDAQVAQVKALAPTVKKQIILDDRDAYHISSLILYGYIYGWGDTAANANKDFYERLDEASNIDIVALAPVYYEEGFLEDYSLDVTLSNGMMVRVFDNDNSGSYDALYW